MKNIPSLLGWIGIEQKVLNIDTFSMGEAAPVLAVLKRYLRQGASMQQRGCLPPTDFESARVVICQLVGATFAEPAYEAAVGEHCGLRQTFWGEEG
jgi:hypothetical protein